MVDRVPGGIERDQPSGVVGVAQAERGDAIGGEVVALAQFVVDQIVEVHAPPIGGARPNRKRNRRGALLFRETAPPSRPSQED